MIDLQENEVITDTIDNIKLTHIGKPNDGITIGEIFTALCGYVKVCERKVTPINAHITCPECYMKCRSIYGGFNP